MASPIDSALISSPVGPSTDLFGIAVAAAASTVTTTAAGWWADCILGDYRWPRVPLSPMVVVVVRGRANNA